jgi:hypothetical protein
MATPSTPQQEQALRDLEEAATRYAATLLSPAGLIVVAKVESITASGQLHHRRYTWRFDRGSA